MSDIAIQTVAFVVECTLKRPGGTVVDLMGSTYHFKPDSEGRHVSIVENAEHLARFMAIPEAYRILGAASTAPAGAKIEVQPAPVVPIPTPQAPAPAAQDATDAITDPAPPAPVSAELTEQQLSDLSDADLRAAYKAAVGRAAPPKAKHETMVDTILEMRAINAAQ